jgi:hypothetical protein
MVPTTYWIGCFGSLAVEISVGLKACQDLDGGMPPRYKRVPYLFFRFAMILCAGSIPVALDSANILSALAHGASAPLFLDKLQRGVDPAKDATTGTG